MTLQPLPPTRTIHLSVAMPDPGEYCRMVYQHPVNGQSIPSACWFLKMSSPGYATCCARHIVTAKKVDGEWAVQRPESCINSEIPSKAKP